MESIPNPLFLLLVMMALAMAPFVALMGTAFLKLSVVMFLVRNALGIQQIPPNMAINGLAFILSLYIMAPVGMQAYDILADKHVDFNSLKNPANLQALKEAAEPFRAFLFKHSNKLQRGFFVRATQKLWPGQQALEVTENHMLVLLPAFTITELTEAFEIGFLLYLPFITIDLIVSNILLAMGMMMVSPMTISLPFKLLLFVLVNGWSRLIHGLVLSYA